MRNFHFKLLRDLRDLERGVILSYLSYLKEKLTEEGEHEKIHNVERKVNYLFTTRII